MTQTSGRSCSSVAAIASRSVSARISTRSVPPSRSARSFTWAADSSPVTSSARRACEIWASADEQQRRLTDAGLAAHEHERGRDKAAAEHAVQLGHPSRDPLGVLALDLGEAEQRTRLCGARWP